MKKIDLYQKVVTLDEFVKMVKQNRIPLVIVLDEVEFNLYKDIENNENFWSKFKSYKYIRNLYYETHLITDESSNKYMILDSIKLTEHIEDKKIKVENFIDQENNKSLVTYVCSNNRLINNPTTIKYLDEKDYTNIKTIAIHDLKMSVAKKYIEEKQKVKNHIN